MAGSRSVGANKKMEFKGQFPKKEGGQWKLEKTLEIKVSAEKVQGFSI